MKPVLKLNQFISQAGHEIMSFILNERHLKSSTIIFLQNNSHYVTDDFVGNSGIVFSKNIVSRDIH